MMVHSFNVDQIFVFVNLIKILFFNLEIKKKKYFLHLDNYCWKKVLEKVVEENKRDGRAFGQHV
jgi:hypothetical protein